MTFGWAMTSLSHWPAALRTRFAFRRSRMRRSIILLGIEHALSSKFVLWIDIVGDIANLR